MKKYWIIFKNEIQKQFLYRHHIISYVGGNFFELFSQIVVWGAIFKTTSIVSGYNYNQMLSYVVIGWIFRFLTTNYEQEIVISKDIKLGRLSNFIVRPMDYPRYVFAGSLGRVAIAFLVVIFQALVWILLLHKNLFVNITTQTLLILFCMFILSYVIKLLISILIGCIAFWTTEVGGLSSAINTFIRFFAGSYFPLDIMPLMFTKIALALPFAYTLYYPTQIFLGRINAMQSLIALGIMSLWAIVLWILVRVAWKFGLKKYESAGI